MNTTTLVHGHDPVPTVFDIERGGVSAEQALAFRDLMATGLHTVLCTWGKCPLWPNWPDRRPSFDDIVHHEGPIGHIPGKLNPALVVYDADFGTSEDIQAFCLRYPPFLQVASRQPGRVHLYYTADGQIKDGTFVGDGVSGDVRAATGYVILWHGAVVRLRDALRRSDGKPAPAPLHLMVDQQAGAAAGSEPDRDGSRGRRRSAPSAVSPEAASPNPLIFDRLRRWAYETPEGTERASWRQRVLEEGHRLNATLGNPLSAREVESMAARIAGWVWERRVNGDASDRPHGKDPAARRDGLASGMARRRGTPLEHDRTPWVTLGCSRSTYYRKFRHLEPGQAPSQSWRPWISLGITAETFRQRVRRALAGTYRGANRGVLPWESVGISEDEWRAHYGSSDTVSTTSAIQDTSANCHAFETEQVLGVGARGGYWYPPLVSQRLCDPVRSAEILMSVVAACRTDHGSASQRRPVAAQAPAGGVGGLEAAKVVATHISTERTRLRSRLVQDSQEMAVAAYLDYLDVPYRAELVRRGLPVHGPRRPRHMPPQYDPTNPKRRQQLGRQFRQAAAHDLRLADLIYAREQRLGTAPSTPPWDRAREEAKIEVQAKGWFASAEERRRRRESERARWETIIATEYRPALTTVAETAAQAYGLAA